MSESTNPTFNQAENGNKSKPLLADVFLEADLKPNLVVKAKWNGENATIKEIKDGNVYYNSAIWKKETVFNDPIKVFLDCFTLLQ